MISKMIKSFLKKITFGYLFSESNKIDVKEDGLEKAIDCSGFDFFYGKIVRVIDGDTLEVCRDCGFGLFSNLRLRLIGYDAYESRGKTAKLGLEAKELVIKYLNDRNLLNGAIIKFSVTKMSYERWLAYIKFETNTYVYDLNSELQELLRKNKLLAKTKWNERE